MYLWYGFFIVSCYNINAYAIGVEISTPVNPVEVGAIFSVLCQVRGLSNQHEVALYRTTVNNETQRLSSKEDVDTDIDERVFLAVRRQVDGSEVYFLTITDFRREDVGDYSCKVIRTSPTITEVGSDDIRTDLLYFPSSSDPQCSSSGDLINIVEGDTLELNCSSELGNPPVAIRWTRAGKSYSNSAAENIIKNRIYSFLSLTITMENNGDLFLCEIDSIVNPYERNCHVGPLKVLPSPGIVNIAREPNDQHIIVTTLQPQYSPEYPVTTFEATSCQDLCPVPVLKPWIISTIVTGVVAIVLLLIIVCSKYTGCVSSVRSTAYIQQRLPDDIYTELQYRKGDLVYVPAEKAKAMLKQSMTERGDFERNPQYDDS